MVVESTFDWSWLVDGFKAQGYAVHQANPVARKRYEGLKYSGDEANGLEMSGQTEVFVEHEGRVTLIKKRKGTSNGGAKTPQSR